MIAIMLNLLFLLLLPLFQVDMDDVVSTEIWLRYPVSQSGYGEGGQFEADLTYEPALPLVLKFGYEDEFILAPNIISSLLQRDSQKPDEIRLLRSGPNEYQFASGEEGQSGTIVLRLNFEDGIAYGWESIEYVLGGSNEAFLLAPVGQPDPRDLDGERCNGGPRIRLQIGGQAATGMASGDLRLADGVNSTSASIVTPVGMVNVIAGPLCVSQTAWWQVSLLDDPQSVAWTPEMDSAQGFYILGPRSDETTTESVICGDALTSRLSVGALVATIEGSTPQFLSSTPKLSADALVEIRDEVIYRVQEGPVCADDVLWWMIEHEGDSGWVAEGQGETYWLEPTRQIIFSDRLQAMTVGG